jgi:5'-nucleotidase
LKDDTSALILVTNDDGVASPGLRAAVETLMDLGEVWVVAPAVQQSGLGRSFPADSSMQLRNSVLNLHGRQVPAYSLDASPAQTVRHAVLSLLPRLPDLSISGINYGENVGGSVTISGTVGAAIEAASFGIPTLAVSLETAREHHFSHSTDVDFSTAAVIMRRFARHVLRHGLAQGVDILKIDVPREAQPDTPWRVTRVARQQYFVNPVTVDQQGQRRLSQYVRKVDLDSLEPDSDVHALAVDRLVSVTPLTIDLTAKVDLQALQRSLSVDDCVSSDGQPSGIAAAAGIGSEGPDCTERHSTL